MKWIQKLKKTILNQKKKKLYEKTKPKKKLKKQDK